MPDLSDLSVHIYADGADKESILKLYANPLIKGITTNPTLMHKAGVRDFEAFARDVLAVVKNKPVAFETVADDFPGMIRQAKKIAAWQNNVYVKIPVTDIRGQSCAAVVRELTESGVKVNVTAVLAREQAEAILPALNPEVPAIISLFAGRISDTGRDAEAAFRDVRKMVANYPRLQLLWASVREIYNIFQADRCGCDIVTVPHDILAKARRMAGMDLQQLSRETVQMFQDDARKAGLTL